MKIKTTILFVLGLAMCGNASRAADLPVVYHIADAGNMVQAPAPSWSLGFYWDFRTKTTSGIVLREIGKVRRPFGLMLDLDVDAFAGSDLQSNLIGGVAIGKSFDVAQNVAFKFAVAVATAQNKPSGAGLIAVLTYRF